MSATVRVSNGVVIASAHLVQLVMSRSVRLDCGDDDDGGRMPDPWMERILAYVEEFGRHGASQPQRWEWWP